MGVNSRCKVSGLYLRSCWDCNARLGYVLWWLWNSWFFAADAVSDHVYWYRWCWSAQQYGLNLDVRASYLCVHVWQSWLCVLIFFVHWRHLMVLWHRIHSDFWSELVKTWRVYFSSCITNFYCSMAWKACSSRRYFFLWEMTWGIVAVNGATRTCFTAVSVYFLGICGCMVIFDSGAMVLFGACFFSIALQADYLLEPHTENFILEDYKATLVLILLQCCITMGHLRLHLIAYMSQRSFIAHILGDFLSSYQRQRWGWLWRLIIVILLSSLICSGKYTGIAWVFGDSNYGVMAISFKTFMIKSWDSWGWCLFQSFWNALCFININQVPAIVTSYSGIVVDAIWNGQFEMIILWLSSDVLYWRLQMFCIILINYDIGNSFDTQTNLLEDTLKKILMNEYISSIIASTVWLNVDIY